MAMSSHKGGNALAARGKVKRAGNGTRQERSLARREAILAAALDEFSAQGFAAARIDEVALRAGVAKGTIYVHFRDKEELFQEIIRSVLSPFVGTIEVTLKSDVPTRAVFEMIIELFVHQVYSTRRKDVIRLILNEGVRFPSLAEFYYREVLSRVLAAVRALLQRAAERGEVPQHIVAFPQLLGAPAIVAILWNSLFEKYEPLDVRAFLHAYLDLVFGKEKAP
jgi:AcrR family transcriptional regulator